MHLDYTKSSYKGKTYVSYRIARSVRKGEKVEKEILFALGKLGLMQVRQIKLILRTIRKPEDLLVVLEKVVPTRAVSYLDVAVADYFWQHWKLDDAFSCSTESELSTAMVARILTLNRCLSPCSHYGIPKWIRRTALDEILGVQVRNLNDDKIYYELDKIAQNKLQIESHLFEVTHERDPDSYTFVNYDLSSSYFVGIRCPLSRFGRSKDKEPHRRQVILAILVNRQGYPFKWDVFPGNQAETRTLEDNVDACGKLGVKSVTMVFDRGLVSKKNLEMLAEKKLKYISALDSPQIPKVPGIKLLSFARLREKETEKQLKSWERFTSFDDETFFQDLGATDGKRNVLSINTKLLREKRKIRRKKLRQFAKFIKTLNAKMKMSKRDRDLGVTRRKVEAELRKLKLTRIFDEPVYKAIRVRQKLADGTTKYIASFQVKVNRKADALAQAKLLDGVCVLISNHVLKHENEYVMKARQIVQAYRDKTEIEDAFKNMKSIVKIRPFFVNTEQHVKAVFTICVLAYHINKTLANQREMIEGKDYLNSNELYDPFKDGRLVKLKDPETGVSTQKVIPPSRETRVLLKSLGLSDLLSLPKDKM